MKRFTLLLTVVTIIMGLAFTVPAFGGGGNNAISSLPYFIETSGYYYVTGDLTTTADRGINVTADHVTIDLQGYSIIGSGPSGGTTGIISEASNLEVRNGTVRNFGGGINATIYSTSTRVINVRVTENNTGITISNNGLVKDCAVFNNAGSGIHGSSLLIINNTVFNNGSGISAEGTVTGNTVYNNGGGGISATGTITGNTVYNNSTSGIYPGQGSVVIGNSVYGNGFYGIDLHVGNILVDNNTAINNDQTGGGYANIRACSTCTFGLNHAP